MSFASTEEFVRASRPALVRRARRLVGTADAEDVVHDAFERALRSRPVRLGSDPRPWLERITRNVAYDALRHRSRAVPAPPAVLDTETPERSALMHETATELESALRTLPPLQRRAIVLHDLQGYSNHEIATLDGVPYHTVRTRLFRARRAMRAALHPETA